MDHWKIGEKQTQSGASFFYDRVKQLRSASEEMPEAPSQGLLKGLEDWSRRKTETAIPASSGPQVPKAHAEKNAEAALGNWKRQIKEYQDLQRNYFERKKDAESLANAEEKKTALHALQTLESQLDRMEWALRQGYRRTRSAVREFKAAS
ncbi:MAG: hypothetical protein K8R69_01095 [Deltaproteobacteria bacterium]|nr:hypothetical protein [Deltaproteobacteria bacterium]